MKQNNYQLVEQSLSFWFKQIEQSWHDLHALTLSPELALCSKIVICGMGGSALGAEVVTASLSPKTRVAIFYNRQSCLPAWVDKDTLIVLTSYSGTTAEVLACAKEAQQKRLSTFVITSGGQLAQMAKKYHWPFYQFQPTFNPAAEPRFGLGYAGGSILALGQILGWWPFVVKELKGLKNILSKKIKINLSAKEYLIVADNNLSGAAHAVGNQLNESAKVLAWWQIVSELNHHLLEGLSGGQVKSNYQTIVIKSKLLSKDIQKRLDLTAAVLQKQGYNVLRLNLVGKTLLEQAWELSWWGGWLSLALAKKSKIDPLAIPWVEYFKKQLK